jgi:hypothetical protein
MGMPKHVDMCRSCGTKVTLEEFEGEAATGEVCGGCGKTVCLASCKRNSCPHADLAPNPPPVSQDEHDKLKALLADPVALKAHLDSLTSKRGSTPVGV